MKFSSLVRGVTWLLVILGVVALCLFFPRFLRVMEVLMRELRYVWWIILLFFLGVYLRQVVGRKRDGDSGR